MRISDWSSDVCSSDLLHRQRRIMADRQPVDIGKPCRRDRQRRPWADDHPSLACIDAHHIKRFRLTADVDSATLAHREVDEPAMAAKHPPLQVDDLAGVIGFRTELPDNGRIIAARYEADIDRKSTRLNHSH